MKKNINIIILEDKPEVYLKALQQLSESLKFELFIFKDLAAATEGLKQRDYDIAIVDGEVPREDGGNPEAIGIEFCELLDGLPIMAVSKKETLNKQMQENWDVTIYSKANWDTMEGIRIIKKLVQNK